MPERLGRRRGCSEADAETLEHRAYPEHVPLRPARRRPPERDPGTPSRRVQAATAENARVLRGAAPLPRDRERRSPTSRRPASPPPTQSTSCATRGGMRTRRRRPRVRSALRRIAGLDPCASRRVLHRRSVCARRAHRQQRWSPARVRLRGAPRLRGRKARSEAQATNASSMSRRTSSRPPTPPERGIHAACLVSIARPRTPNGAGRKRTRLRGRFTGLRKACKPRLRPAWASSPKSSPDFIAPGDLRSVPELRKSGRGLAPRRKRRQAGGTAHEVPVDGPIPARRSHVGGMQGADETRDDRAQGASVATLRFRGPSMTTMRDDRRVPPRSAWNMPRVGRPSATGRRDVVRRSGSATTTASPVLVK
jgi:hypothetical protein